MEEKAQREKKIQQDNTKSKSKVCKMRAGCQICTPVFC